MVPMVKREKGDMVKTHLRPFLFFLLFVFFQIPLSAQADQTEQITLTTYYPAPYGVYCELKAERLTLGETTFTTVQGSSDCPKG